MLMIMKKLLPVLVLAFVFGCFVSSAQACQKNHGFAHHKHHNHHHQSA